MAAFDFPASPANGQVYTANGVSYIYSATDGAWTGGPLTDTGLWQPKDANLTALGALADNAQGYPYFDGAGGATSTIAATAAEFRAGVAAKVLENDDVWAAAALVPVTYAATTTIDMSSGINFSMAPTGALTLANPVTNSVPGKSGAIVLTSTGDQTLAFGSNWLFPNGTKPSALANGKPTTVYYFYTGSVYLCGAGEQYA